ncbi:MAG: hypothetical protein V4617_07920 [Gemmatimonadota bacterium]
MISATISLGMQSVRHGDNVTVSVIVADNAPQPRGGRGSESCDVALVVLDDAMRPVPHPPWHLPCKAHPVHGLVFSPGETVIAQSLWRTTTFGPGLYWIRARIDGRTADGQLLSLTSRGRSLVVLP